MLAIISDGVVVIVNAVWIRWFARETWPIVYKPGWMLIKENWRNRLTRRL